MSVGHLVKHVFASPFYCLYERFLQCRLTNWQIPEHIGIILDGNRRWARSKGSNNVVLGHEKGADKLDEVLNWCYDSGIKIVTIWIFSTDNFKRGEEEVNGLFSLIEHRTKQLKEDPKIHNRGVKVNYIGRIDSLPKSLQESIHETELSTAEYENCVLNVAIAYGGREEIMDAFKTYAKIHSQDETDLASIIGSMKADDLTPYMYTAELKEPDLIIRTSGEIRMSGFMLWQAAYSEYYFCDTFWPAFRKIDFFRALRSYHGRKRRYGK
ncbi:MAG: polyprenyl diphosphate synthase [Lentisphaeria bacterium]|nr:polyprenyl diphosphate synthase [Lentisphaeria bacterium]